MCRRAYRENPFIAQEGHGGDRTGVSLVGLLQGAGRDIPDLHRRITAANQDPLAVRTEGGADGTMRAIGPGCFGSLRTAHVSRLPPVAASRKEAVPSLDATAIVFPSGLNTMPEIRPATSAVVYRARPPLICHTLSRSPPIVRADRALWLERRCQRDRLQLSMAQPP